MAKIITYQIPFWNYTPENCGQYLNYEMLKNENGSLASYVNNERCIEWRDNYVFAEILELTTWSRGRSSATFTLSDDQGHKYDCFMHSAFEIFIDKRFNAGLITARWTFEKCGQNYGIKLAK